jgi:hypothetical protein
MKRSLLLVLTVGMVGSTFANRAAAEPSAIATSMGDLRWGMSESDVASYAQRRLTEQYNAEIAKAKDGGKQSKLRAELKHAQSDAAKSLTSFDEGQHSRWDHSPVAGEFNYGDGESLLVAKAPEADNYYFFVNGRLWKWVEVLDKSAAGGGDFKKFSASVESKFGKGRVKKGELTPGQGNTQWLEFLDRNSRMRAADHGKRGGFALIYEEMATVRELASSRPQKPSRAGGASDDDESEVKSTAPKTQSGNSDDGQLAKGPSKRSMFAAEHQNESDSDYQTRKQKAAADAHDKAQRAHDRKEESKKGEALKQLDGLSDSDPLGGL